MVFAPRTLFHLFLPIISASPTLPPPSRARLHLRQAIPDLSGHTGNDPALVHLDPPPYPTPPITTTPTPTLLPPSNPPTSTITPPADQLHLLRTSPPLTPAALAGIITGSTVLLILLLALATHLIRRTRRPDIAEIPIRRSKLGSRLRHRIFTSPVPPERADSRGSDTRTLTGGVRKEGIGRPQVPGEMLEVPRAAWMRWEGEGDGVDERWVPRKTPMRPRSAEPLGRLSGMGRGMGYLK